MAYSRVLKTRAFGIEGSNPSLGTNLKGVKMIRTKKEEVKEIVEKPISIECDICKTHFDFSDVKDQMDIQEFTHIDFVGGYGSRFGDGVHMRCDICQNCLKGVLGEFLRVVED